jgi:site-specific recombinase XerD
MSNRQLPLFPEEPTSSGEISAETPLNVTLDFFADYLRREGKSEHTVKAFMGDMRLLAERTSDEMPVGEYTTAKLNDYLRWMESVRGVPCSRKTYARRVTTLKVYFKWLHSEKAIPHDPAKAILQRSGPAPLSKALTEREVQAAIDAARSMKRGEDQDYRPELLFRLLLDTGTKKGETGRLTPADVIRDPQQPHVYIRHKAKDIYKERRINVSPDWLLLLDLYMEQYKPKDRIFNCTTRNLEYILTDVGKLAGIEYKLSFEIMRWTTAVRDFRAGKEEDDIRDKLGLSKTSWYETGNKIRRLAARQLEQELDAADTDH